MTTQPKPATLEVLAGLIEKLHEKVDKLADHAEPDRFMRKRDVLPISGFGSESTFKVKVKDGEFPAPVQISEGRVAWSAREIRAWQELKRAERDARLAAQGASKLGDAA